MNQLKLLAFAGSIRPNSLNEKVLSIALEHLANHNVTVNYLKLHALKIPLFNDEIFSSVTREHDIWKLKSSIAEADVILIASPEYNGSIPGVLKNAIDWVSYNIEDEKGYQQPFSGKLIGLMSASPSPFRGVRALLHLQDILFYLKSIIMPEYASFSCTGELNEQQLLYVKSYIDNLVKFAKEYFRETK